MIVCFVYTDQVMASGITKLAPEQEVYELGSLMELLEDENNNITLEEIAAGKWDDQFYLYEGNIPNYGYTPSTFWMRITFENRSANSEWMLEIAYPPHDSIELYTKSDDGKFRSSKTGDRLLFYEREVHHRNFIFELDIPPGSMQTYYVKLDSDGSMQLPVTLWSRDAFRQKSQLEYILLGIYYGFSLFMILYHLFLFFSLKLSRYLWYILFIVTLMLMHFTLNGLAYQYIWPEESWWNHRAILFFIVCTNMTGLLFVKSFIDTKYYLPGMDKVMKGIVFLQPILMAILFFNYEVALNIIMAATVGTISLIIMPSIILSWRRGHVPAKYFFYGWTAFFIGALVSSIADMGLLPVNFLTTYSSQIGSVIGITLFSLALGERIRQLRKEKKEAEESALKSRELAVRHLKKTNELKDEFLANTSHELRTPLHGMIGLAEFIKEREGSNEEIQHNLSLIISSGKRLAQLIEDLLDASKLKHQDLNLEISRVNLKKLTDMVCTISKSMNRSKFLTIQNKINEHLPHVAGDQNRLQQILYNLLGNAIKYTDKGEITITAEQDRNMVIVSVRDSGIGMSEKDKMHIFDSFTRGSNIEDRSEKGAGLGLRITKQLVELHGGRIEVESALGEGTNVSFSIPIFKEEEIGVRHYFTSSEQAGTSVLLHHENPEPLGKILIADDEPVNIQVLLNHLSMAGYQIKVADDGVKVLDELRNDRSYDLVILDVMLPKISGFDAAKKIRGQFSLTDLPILMLTARSQTEDIITAFNAGANDYLTKPTSREELLARVKTLLSLKQTMEEVVKVNKELTYLNHSLESLVAERTQELELRTDELARMEKSRRQLMSNISHELGTPMTSVRGYIKAMLDGVVDRNDESYLHMVYKKILVIDRLIQDLYDLSRLEARRVSFRWQQVTAGEILNMLLLKYEREVKENGLNFYIYSELNEAESRESVLIDADRLDQVLQNLIFNAIRFTKADGTIRVHMKKVIPGEEPKLRKTLTEWDALLKITVADDGKGISEEAIAHVFDRFFQEEKPQTEEDTHSGLGLSISKEIIDAHHGHLWAESEWGEGSAFHFVLPLGRKEDEEACTTPIQ